VSPRILVLGAGSIGSRHARELCSVGADVDVADPDPSRSSAVGVGRAVPFDLDRLDGYDGIVVASPTTFHAEQARAALATGAWVLVEKPLATASDGLDELVSAGKGRLMVGYNLRLHEPIRRLVDLVHGGRAGRVSAVRVWFGSWLPDWRPGVDYRTTYSARADLGGGVLFDAIHELDILVWLLGVEPFDVVGAVVDRLGPLEIDVEDTVKAVLRHSSGVVAEVALDYLSRRYRRGIEVVGDAATVRLDWARSVLEVEDGGGIEVQAATEPVAASYALQAARFLAFVAGDAEPPVDGETAAASVRLAEAIRRAGAVSHRDGTGGG
jgi:predicted dehydrogenase